MCVYLYLLPGGLRGIQHRQYPRCCAGGAGRHPGNLLMQPPPVAADEPPAAAPAEQLQDDSSESAELAALAAYEARVAPQQASALPTATMPPGALVAHDPTQALGSGMPIVAGQLAQGGNVTTGTGAVQMPAPVEAPTAAARVPPFLARSRQALAPPHLGSLPAQEGRASPAAQPEVVDLTLDSPVSLQQQHGRGGGPEYVDLLAASVSSPTKRRHGMAQQASMAQLGWVFLYAGWVMDLLPICLTSSV